MNDKILTGNETKEVKVFSNAEFGDLRTLEIEGETWFVGKDVADALGYSNSRKALIDHVYEEDKGVTKCDTLGGVQNLAVINESGLYSLILSSKLPTAKKFKRWITSEVLPSIRKHGAYLTPDKIEEVLYNPDVIIKIATQLKEEQEKNRLLTVTNAALTKETNTWDGRAVINALVRAFGAQRLNFNYAFAFNTFYKKLLYSMHINLKTRKTKSTKPNVPLLDFIKDDEMSSAIQVAVAMCEESGIKTGNVINETNLAMYQ